MWGFFYGSVYFNHSSWVIALWWNCTGQSRLMLCNKELFLDKELLDVIYPFPNKPWFLCVCSTSLLKTLREKKKLLVMSNFSFHLSVFYPFRQFSAIFMKFEIIVCKLFQFGTVWNLSFGNGLITFSDSSMLDRIHSSLITVSMIGLCESSQWLAHG